MAHIFTRLRLLQAPALLGIAALAGCAVIPDPTAMQRPALAEGTPVALTQPVEVGDVLVTPMSIVEDSRCPINARCVWAGRLIVKTRIDGEGWRDTADITLGETYGTHGRVIALVSAEPDKITQSEIEPGSYLFVFEDRTPDPAGD